MTNFVFEKMTLGMILDTTFKLYFRNMIKMVSLVAGPYLILMILNMAMFIPMMMGMDEIAIMVGAAGGGIFYVISIIILQPLLIGAVTITVSKLYLGEEISMKEAYAFTWKRWGTLLWTIIVVGLLVGLGTLLCIIPGIYLHLSFAMVIPVVMLEGYSSDTSRSRAWNLAEGRRLEIFVVLVVFWGIKFLISMGVASFALFLPVGGPQEIANIILQFGATIIVEPLSLIAPVLLYYNARIAKEGFDIEMLAMNVMGENPAMDTDDKEVI